MYLAKKRMGQVRNYPTELFCCGAPATYKRKETPAFNTDAT